MARPLFQPITRLQLPEFDRGRRGDFRSWFKRLVLGEGERRVRLRTLIMVRWVAIIGQAFTVILVQASLGIDLPVVPLAVAIVASCLVNLGLSLGASPTTRLTERAAALLLGYDILQLAFLLALTGGLKNPFAVLLLVPTTISATILSLRTTIGLSALVVLALTVLGLWPSPLPWHGPEFALPPLYLAALWSALVLACVLLAGYAWRVADEARRMSDALSATQIALAREQRLSALGGLAAAAAHELGSPLATIAITARELADALPEDSPFGEDVQELVTQSRRCRDILRWLSEQPEPDQHDAFIRMPLSRLLEGIARPHQDGGTEIEIRVEVEDGAQEPVLNPLPTVRHGLGNLIQNAVQFARRRVRIRVLVSVDQVRVVIEDDGPGFAPEVMEQLGEPYVSTRRDEGGLGLGVFIAQTLLARSGASLRFETRRGGATVEVNWPRDRLEHYLAEEPR